MKPERAEKQYLDGLRKIYEEGTDIENPRTKIKCRTYINIDLTYDCTTDKLPLLTTRKIPNPYIAIAELLGYIKGFTSAKQFRELGTKTWDANANLNEKWLNNPNRKGEDDLGLIYGAVAKNWPIYKSDKSLDLFKKVYNNLKNGIDDRGEIITFWNPGMFEYGCLRPCMYEHQFSLIEDKLYLNSTQRSADWCLGTAANMIQVYLLLKLMAQITNKKPMYAFHRNVNCHIYENQLPLVPEQLKRELLEEPTIEINPDIKTLEDIETWVTLDDFKINYPEYYPPIKYPFTV